MRGLGFSSPKSHEEDILHVENSDNEDAYSDTLSINVDSPRRTDPPLEVNVIQDDHRRHFAPNQHYQQQGPNVHELHTLAMDSLVETARHRPDPRRIRQAAHRVRDLEDAIEELGLEEDPVWMGRIDELYSRMNGNQSNQSRKERIVDARRNDLHDHGNNPWAFNSHASPGPRSYYEQFPHPWNVTLFKDERERGQVIAQSKIRIEIPCFSGKYNEDYYAWRACFIAHVHRSHQDVNSKMLTLIQCLSESVKQNLAATSEFSPRGYHRVVTALERKYGGAKRLLTAALNSIRQHPAVRTDRIQDLEHYVHDVEIFFDRLDEAGLGEERQTQSTFKDLIRPLPFPYVTEFYTHAKTCGVERNSDELFRWARSKLENMQDVYEVKAPTVSQHEPQKEIRICYNNFAQGDDDCHGEEQHTTVSCKDEREWCHIVAQDREGNCCPLCSSPKEQAEHRITECPHFKKLPFNAKRVIFWQFRLCYVCGNRKHTASNCKAPKCQKCGKGHHVILHNSELENAANDSKLKEGTSFGVNGQEDKVSLLTLTVRVKNPKTDKNMLVNCLLDSGSTLALMSTRLADQIEFTGYKTPLALLGAGGKRADYCTVLGDIVVEHPKGDDCERVMVRVIDNPAGDHTVPEITEMRTDLDIAERANDRKIDLILGCTSPRLFLAQDIRKEAEGKRIFIKTPLGWGMMGQIQDSSSAKTNASMFIEAVEPNNLPFEVIRFHKITHAHTSSPLPEAEELYEKDSCLLNDHSQAIATTVSSQKPTEAMINNDNLPFSEAKEVQELADRATSMELDWSESVLSKPTSSAKVIGLVYLAKEVEFTFKFTIEERNIWTKLAVAKTYSHQMGLVEVGVRSAKQALNAVLSSQSITADELHTALVMIKGLLNTRPIATIPTSSGDVAVMAADFLGANGIRRLNSIGHEWNIISVVSIAKRWMKLNTMLDRWWRIFYSKDFTELHKRNKWSRNARELKEGDIVLFRETGSLRGDWPMGIIIKIQKGRDCIVHLVRESSTRVILGLVHVKRQDKVVERYPKQVVYLMDDSLHH